MERLHINGRSPMRIGAEVQIVFIARRIHCLTITL